MLGDFSTTLEMTGRFVVPPLAEGKVVRSTKGGDGASRQTVRLSDVRLAVCRETYFLLTTRTIVQEDFSTPLRSARNDRGGALRQYLASFLRKEVAQSGDGG